MRLCGSPLGEDMETFYLGVRSGFWLDTPVICTLLAGHNGLHSARGVMWDDRVARQWHLPNEDIVATVPEAALRLYDPAATRRP